jgi:hypothetical protein
MGIDRTPWTADKAVARPLLTQDNTNREKTQTFMPRMGFEPPIPVFDQGKAFGAFRPRGHSDWHKVKL